jgi:hypothetical protein
MRRKQLVAAIAFVAGVIGSIPAALAQDSDRDDRVAASFLLALGRAPQAAERAEWANASEAQSVSDFVARHRRGLEKDGTAHQAVVARAAFDAFGRTGDAGAGDTTGTYAEIVQRHVEWLRGHTTEYEEVVQRAYRAVLQRDAYSVEIDYWKRQPVVSFVLLVGCVENWAARNQPGLMATVGTPSISVNTRWLTALRVSPAVAAEARAAIGQKAPGAEGTAAGRHVVAPGAESIESVGGVHVAVIGGARLDVRPTGH